MQPVLGWDRLREKSQWNGENLDLTEDSRQPQRSNCGERPLDELATVLARVKIHGGSPHRHRGAEA